MKFPGKTCLENGKRTLYALINVEGSQQIPSICEPWWLSLNAQVDLIPAMTQEEFGKANVNEVVKKYS